MTEEVLWVGVYGEGTSFAVRIPSNATVDDLKTAIVNMKKDVNELFRVDPATVNLYFAREKNEDGSWSDKWLKSDETLEDWLRDGRKDNHPYEEMIPSWNLDLDYLGSNFNPGRHNIHILLELPQDALTQTSTRVENLKDAVWLGDRGSSVAYMQNISLSDEKTLHRHKLTDRVISHLDSMHLLLIKSPPMTGKTSLATLVAQKIVKRAEDLKQKVVVANLSMLGAARKQSFDDFFHDACGFEWLWINKLPTRGYTVYFIIDEAQILYSNGKSSLQRKSSEFWRLVKQVRNSSNTGFRILIFAAFGSDLQYVDLSTPVEIPEQFTMNIKDMNFGMDEIQEYVMKWFMGFYLLGESAQQFCARLQLLTGGHVGLCATVIDELNKKFLSCCRSSSGFPCGEMWVRMLSMEDKELEKDKIFETLLSTRAVYALKTLDSRELDALERVLYNVDTELDTSVITKCIRGGILIEKDKHIEFASPVMWRYFAKVRFGDIKRALNGPTTLHDMILRVMQTIDYGSIRQTLGRTLSNEIPLERSWQMEFYKALFQCSTSTWVTSADVGGVFGSRGFIDFTIHSGNNFWGIELLREGNNLKEHIDRFAYAGPYSVLGLTDYCLVDFRRVGLLDDAMRRTIDSCLKLCEKLYVVCYDPALTQAVIFSSRGQEYNFSLLNA